MAPWNGQNPGRIPVSLRQQKGARVAWSGQPNELLSLVSLARERGLQVNLPAFGVALRTFACVGG